MPHRETGTACSFPAKRAKHHSCKATEFNVCVDANGMRGYVFLLPHRKVSASLLLLSDGR